MLFKGKVTENTFIERQDVRREKREVEFHYLQNQNTAIAFFLTLEKDNVDILKNKSISSLHLCIVV